MMLFFLSNNFDRNFVLEFNKRFIFHRESLKLVQFKVLM